MILIYFDRDWRCSDLRFEKSFKVFQHKILLFLSNFRIREHQIYDIIPGEHPFRRRAVGIAELRLECTALDKVGTVEQQRRSQIADVRSPDHGPGHRPRCPQPAQVETGHEHNPTERIILWSRRTPRPPPPSPNFVAERRDKPVGKIWTLPRWRTESGHCPELESNVRVLFCMFLADISKFTSIHLWVFGLHWFISSFSRPAVPHHMGDSDKEMLLMEVLHQWTSLFWKVSKNV